MLFCLYDRQFLFLYINCKKKRYFLIKKHTFCADSTNFKRFLVCFCSIPASFYKNFNKKGFLVGFLGCGFRFRKPRGEGLLATQTHTDQSKVQFYKYYVLE